jgi:hypothetical protein
VRAALGAGLTLAAGVLIGSLLYFVLFNLGLIVLAVLVCWTHQGSLHWELAVPARRRLAGHVFL